VLLSGCRSVCTTPYAGLNIHAGMELAVPAPAQMLHFFYPHYSDMLTKNNMAKDKEEKAKSVPGKSSLQTLSSLALERKETLCQCYVEAEVKTNKYFR